MVTTVNTNGGFLSVTLHFSIVN